MRRLLAAIALGALIFGPGAAAADKTDEAKAEASQLRKTLLDRHKGSTVARIQSLMGTPGGHAQEGAGEVYTWNLIGVKQGGGSCSMQATFTGGALSDLQFPPPDAWNKKGCHTLARPLLKADGPGQS